MESVSMKTNFKYESKPVVDGLVQLCGTGGTGGRPDR